MVDSQEYLDGILAELSKIKEKHGTGLFRINDKITDSTASFVKDYFKDSPIFVCELRKCHRCSNTWDVIITIRY